MRKTFELSLKLRKKKLRNISHILLEIKKLPTPSILNLVKLTWVVALGKWLVVMMEIGHKGGSIVTLAWCAH